ncbi:hypothetical protein E2562_013731 [Oryza meyeriana var. granulata]|uniref:Uncharacterized protein n=1 Tax=Oryza meyeriana var. granulata TaxID=110450 RepID=A0A6G1BKP4_9ORYZ|nr:hypothetical protein E2562_013731 [Oryza meyeriana var. granulata]
MAAASLLSLASECWPFLPSSQKRSPPPFPSSGGVVAATGTGGYRHGQGGCTLGCHELGSCHHELEGG